MAETQGGWISKADASGSQEFYGAGVAGQPPGVEPRRCRQQRRVPPGNYGIQASPWSLRNGGFPLYGQSAYGGVARGTASL